MCFWLSFEADGRQHLVAGLAGGIVKNPDVVEYPGLRLVPLAVHLAVDPLSPEQDETTLVHGNGVAVAAAAHRGVDILVLQERGPLQDREPAALIRMYQRPVLRHTSPDSCQQRL